MSELKLSELKTSVIHFIGIGGISMSALAQMLVHFGAVVQGSDVARNAEVEILEKQGIKVFLGHSKNNIDGADVVVYTSAVHGENEELAEARNRGLLIISRAELLGLISKKFEYVTAIAGSHGKTTATAMISEIFLAAGLDPTLHVGGKLKKIDSNYRLGSKTHFVTEACEYQDNFLKIHPDVALILNVDGDHLDYFGSLDGVKNSFAKFAKSIRCGGVIIVSADDKNSKHLRQGENVTTFGFSRRAEMRAVEVIEYEPGKFQFDAEFMGAYLGTIKLGIIGKHNILNALAAMVVGLVYDIDFEIMKEALENFAGVERRCEEIGQISGARIFHDYAHHPKQIESMMRFAKSVTAGGGRIITVFEPHTYSRTKFLLSDFAKSFSGTNTLILLPAYSAREDKSAGVDSDVLAGLAKKHVKDVRLASNYNEVYSKLKAIAKPKDIILILGAGNIEELAKMIKKHSKC